MTINIDDIETLTVAQLRERLKALDALPMSRDVEITKVIFEARIETVEENERT